MSPSFCNHAVVVGRRSANLGESEPTAKPGCTSFRAETSLVIEVPFNRLDEGGTDEHTVRAAIMAVKEVVSSAED
jgi:hypothetical protein